MTKTQDITYTITNPTELAQFFADATPLLLKNEYFMYSFMVYDCKISIEWQSAKNTQNSIDLVWRFETIPDKTIEYINRCELIMRACIEHEVRYLLPTFIGLDDVKSNETPNLMD